MPKKDAQVYTMKIELKGEPRILTIRVSDKLEIMVTDEKGNMIEYIKQDGNALSATGPGAALKKAG